ncbi:hypothetical protein B5D80_12955 [Micromonospora wenchangensis]|uniref:Uncharacterized protein n=1 Tax=Micromonospora wenchangensis TaxID=1185415 RepID=A0A246RN05_9ACTN|nr:hypothetical protein B5D80_12955 [Micromonospora wenchangensis]
MAGAGGRLTGPEPTAGGRRRERRWTRYRPRRECVGAGTSSGVGKARPANRRPGPVVVTVTGDR